MYSPSPNQAAELCSNFGSSERPLPFCSPNGINGAHPGFLRNGVGNLPESPDLSSSDIREVCHVERDDDDSSTTSEIYLSVFWLAGKMGAAYYETSTLQVHLLMDTIEKAPEFDIFNQIVYQLNPTYIITSGKQDERLILVLQEIERGRPASASSASTAESGGFPRKKVVLLPSFDFGLEASKRRIAALSTSDMPKLLTDRDRSMYINSLINFEYVAMIRALGGLLRYLDKRRVGVELEDRGISVPIVAINTFSLNDLVTMDSNTYGVMMLRPTYNVDVIRQRQQAISFFMKDHNVEVMYTLQSCLKEIRNVPSILTRMTIAEASVKDWQAMYKTIYNAMLIGDLCKAQPQTIEIFDRVSRTFTDELSRIATLISKIIDFPESFMQNHFVVKWGVDEQLDAKKRLYNGLPSFMSKIAEQELNNLPEDITTCTVIYLPQLGYLLAIPMTSELELTNYYEIPGLDYKFTSNKTVYYRTVNTKELDKLLGDSQFEISV